MKRIGTRLAELTRLFEITGAPELQKWAESEVREDIPQLASFLFLRQAWREVVAEGDTQWLHEALADAKRHPHAPGASVVGRRSSACWRLGATRPTSPRSCGSCSGGSCLGCATCSTTQA